MSGVSRRDQEPAAENDQAALVVDERASRSSARANGGDAVAEAGDAASKKWRSSRNGAANNGTEDRANLSPAKLAEAVQDDQDSDQPS